MRVVKARGLKIGSFKNNEFLVGIQTFEIMVSGSKPKIDHTTLLVNIKEFNWTNIYGCAIERR